jgi:type II secretory pathway component PulM
MNLREKMTQWGRKPAQSIAREWDRMAPRERRLVVALGAAVIGFIFLVSGFLVVDSLRGIAESNDNAREALSAIAKHRDDYLDAKNRMMAQDARIGTEPPQLAADLEAAARDVGIQIPESNERPAAAAGRRFNEHNVDIKLRQVDLLSLTKFLSKLETGRRLIVVTRMNVRRRFDGDKLDVELTATAFERIKGDVKKRKGTKV